MDSASSLFKAKKYKETIHICIQLLDKNPDLIEALKLISKSLLAINQIDKARLYLNKALKINPDDYEIFKDLGNTYQACGKIDIAKGYYQQAIKINSSYAPALTNLGNVEIIGGNKNEGISLLVKATECDPKLTSAWRNLANGYIQLGNMKKAEISINKSIELNPHHFNSYFLLSTILIAQNKLESAEQSLLKAIELKPELCQAHINLGAVLKDLGKLQEAESSIRNAIEINPYLFNSYFLLAMILIEQKKLKEAEKSLRKTIELNPDFGHAHIVLGEVLQDLGKSQEAKLETKKGVDACFIQHIDSKSKDKCLKNLSLSKSQFRQDLFTLSELGFKKNGFFVEFGSCDGLVGSNSYLLEKFYNWNGILAEPALYWHQRLKRNRSVNIETKCVWKSSGKEIFFNEPFEYKQKSSIEEFTNIKQTPYKEGKRYQVTTISLLDLLDLYNAPKNIDYLSLDTEGSEYEILKAFDFNKYRFNVITCEHNFTSMRDKIYNLLTSNGYKRKLTEISRVDDWYVYCG